MENNEQTVMENIEVNEELNSTVSDSCDQEEVLEDEGVSLGAVGAVVGLAAAIGTGVVIGAKKLMETEKVKKLGETMKQKREFHKDKRTSIKDVKNRFKEELKKAKGKKTEEKVSETKSEETK